MFFKIDSWDAGEVLKIIIKNSLGTIVTYT